jgi:hypothetical protein
MKEKAMAQASDTGKRTARRLKLFKAEGVKPTGCLKKNLGCNKTEHFFFDREDSTVKCTFDKQKGCFSPFPRKQAEKKKKIIKKVKKIKEKAPEEAKKPAQKKKKGKKARFKQIEFEVPPPPPEALPKEHKFKKAKSKLMKKSLGL